MQHFTTLTTTTLLQQEYICFTLNSTDEINYCIFCYTYHKHKSLHIV